MIIFYYNKDKINHVRMIRYLHDSYTGDKRIFETSAFDKNHSINIAAKCIVFAGMIRGEGLIYKWCRDNKKEFLYLDHAYLGRGYNPADPDSEWMRIAKSDFVWNKLEKRLPDRWQELFAENYKLSPWRSNGGKKILVLPPSTATRFLFPKCDQWMQDTLARLRQSFDDSDIVIREKPHQVILDQKTNKILSRIDHEHTKTIDEELEEAKLIVTYSSAVPVMGTIMGIPCLTSDNAAARPMSMDIDNLQDTIEPDRLGWVHQLVHHQYTVSEMRSGKFWQMLGEWPDA